MKRLSDEDLAHLLVTVTRVGNRPIPFGTPCFWDTRDRVSCTYSELQSVIEELQERRKATT